MSVAQDRLAGPTLRVTRLPHIVEALTSALRIAAEAAIFPNRFEVDEQEPRSRLEALTEQILHDMKSRPSHPEEAADIAATISIIDEMAKRIRAKIC